MVGLTFQYRREESAGLRVALFPGAWNPPTVAHVAMARAALRHVDETIWLLPRAFPHKGFDGASLDQRIDMLCRIAQKEGGFSVAVCESGLYFEMAREAEQTLGSEAEISLLCGKDAAERIAGWDYGRSGVFDEMVDRYRLLVAERAGEYLPAARHAERVVRVALSDLDEVSSTELRRRITEGLPWRHLTPAAIAESVAEIYQSDTGSSR